MLSLCLLTPPHIAARWRLLGGRFIAIPPLPHFPSPPGLHAARSWVPRPHVPTSLLGRSGAGLGVAGPWCSGRPHCLLEAGNLGLERRGRAGWGPFDILRHFPVCLFSLEMGFLCSFLSTTLP